MKSELKAFVAVAVLTACAACVPVRETGNAGSVRIRFDMPEDGKATVVLDGPDGRRVRNLVNGIAFAKGRHVVEWDGRAEDGTGAEPGEYTVRVVTHPGIGYDYKGSFAAGGERMFSGFGPNHLPCTMMCAMDDVVIASSLFTEGGNSTLVLSHDGRLLNGYGDGWNLGNKACDYISGPGEWFYSVREKDGNVLEFHGYALRRNARIRTELVDAPPTALKGAVRIGERVYLSNAITKTIDVYRLEEQQDRARLAFTGERMPCEFAGPLAADGDTVVRALAADQSAIAVKGDELFALVDGDTRVHVYDRKSGRETRVFGEPGGGYAGPWRKDRLVDPTGLAFDAAGSLWIAERRYNPKRISRWDAVRGVCDYEKVGSEKYGSPGVGMDEEDATRWIAHDTEWRYDPAKGVDGPVALLFNEKLPQGDTWEYPRRESRTYRFVRRDGRTFVIGNDGVTCVWEYLEGEHRLKPLVMIGSSGFYSHMIGRQHTCVPMGEAYAKAFPDRGGDRFKHDEETLMVWRDRDGDEKFDADEFEFAPFGTGAPCGWGLFASGLDFTLPYLEDGALSFFDLKYPDWSLKDALAARRPAVGRLPNGSVPPRRDSCYDTCDGRFIYTTLSPYMLAFRPDGSLDWYMKNPWTNVHGSHDAPLPRPGELQGALFPLGSVPAGANGEYEVFALKNNHGRVFFVTSDGLYLDEIFSDCRVAAANDETYIGGESFGGSFQYDRNGRRAVLTSGGGGYRWYEITNLMRVREKKMKMTFSTKELIAAQEANPVETARKAGPASLAVPDAKRPETVAKWQSGAWHVRLAACRDGGKFRLAFNVNEPSPWVNRGTDPYLMFKTGDAVDFQWLDEKEGPCRLMVFPPDKAVLYRHDVKGASHDFASPWRSHTVGDVSFPTDLNVKVRSGGADYEVSFDVPGDFSRTSALTADFGVIFGDRDGTINQSRVYWSNKDTGLVNDVPGEIIPTPKKWGTVRFDTKVEGSEKVAGESGSIRLVRTDGTVNPYGIVVNKNGKGYHREVYSAGPVWDAKRRLLYASAGQGRVNAMTLEGEPVASYTLPDARPFDRFDSMALDEATGEVFVLAGGLAAQDARRNERRAGRLYRIRPGAPTAELIAEKVCAISQKVRDGRLAAMTPDSTLEWISCRDGSREPISATPVRNGSSYPCLIDFTPDGKPLAFVEHRNYYVYENGEPIGPRTPFGNREICMTRGAILGDVFWALNGETVKRYDARTMKPSPGVVYGGASGWFIGHVEMDSGLHAVGVCEIPDGRLAFLSAVNNAVYVMRYDPASWRLVPERRLGGVFELPNFMLDDDGYLVADSLVWGPDAKANDMTDSSLVRMSVRATVALPGGSTVHIHEMHGKRIEVRHGKLAQGELRIDHNRDVREYPEPHEGHDQRWGAYVPVAAFAEPAENGTVAVRALRIDGVLKTYLLDGEGHPLPEGKWCREETLPNPEGVSGDFMSFAPLPDGRYVVQIFFKAYAYRFVEGAWRCEGAIPALDGNGIAADGTRLAVVDDNELRIHDFENGAYTLAAKVKGFHSPRHVVFRNGRIAVWEKYLGRILRFDVVSCRER